MSNEPKSYHHGDLRNAMIETGIKIVNEQGIESCSLRKVALQCNVSHAAPYAHFKNKEELLSAMQNHVTEKFVAVCNEIQTEYATSEKLILKLGRKYVEFFSENPNYYTFLFSQNHFQIDLTRNFMETNSYAPFQMFKENCLLVLREAGASLEESRRVIMGAWGVVHGLAGMSAMPSVKFDGNWGEITEEILLRMEQSL